jgi:serine/threonine protein phosphatase PrpC
MPNQDAWKAGTYRWGNVLAVSDGLSSKTHSRIGARAACNAVIETARHFAAHPSAPVKTIPQLIHSLWQMRLETYNVSDCCATCLFAIQISDRIILGRIGDGLIAVFGEPESPVFMTEEKDDDDSNITDCLGKNFRPDSWEIRELNASVYSSIMICTDGVSDDLTTRGREIFPRDILGRGKNLEELRRTLVEWKVQGHSDDKTIACLVNNVKDTPHA